MKLYESMDILQNYFNYRDIIRQEGVLDAKPVNSKV